ncbi:MAG: hypothetical protein ACK4YF_08155, partial [Exilispira sp.]
KKKKLNELKKLQKLKNRRFDFMKKYFIILVSLIVLWVVPVLAEAPSQENAPMGSQQDSLFLGQMSQLSEEQLLLIIGTMEEVDGSGQMVYNSNTDHLIDTSNGDRYKFVKEFRIFYQAGMIYAGMSFLITGITSSSDLAKILQSSGIFGTIASITVTTEIIKVVLIGGGVILISVSLFDILKNGIYVYKLVKI